MLPGEQFFYSSITRPLLYQEVVNKLLEAVSKGYVEPGEKFPPEREIVDRWKISRNVLREAFHILRERGLVISIQGKGRFLRALPDKEMWSGDTIKTLERSSLREIYDVRRILELRALELASQRATGEGVKRVETIYRRLSKRFQKTRQTRGEFELHIGYARLSGNFFLEEMISLTLKKILEFMSSTFHEVLQWHASEQAVENMIRDHGLILQYIQAGKSKEAQAVMNEHFKRTLDRLDGLR